MRQPKRKEKLLSPVWGRLVYWSSTNDYSGAAIYLEAQEVNCLLKWSKSLTPEYAKELKRLENDGHLITSDRRYYTIKHTIEAIRNTQLYRTLPHEIGHYVDYVQTVEQPSGDNFDLWNSLNKLYANKPQHDKEAFAHRYADRFRALHIRNGRLPFARIIDENQMISMGLMPEWFSYST